MKFLKNILFKTLILTMVISCDTEGGIDDDVFAIAGNAPIASWITSAEGSDLLKLSDTDSPVPYEIEFIDASNGNSVNAFTMIVVDSTSEILKTGVLISQTTFTANTDGIQGFSGSFSLNDIFSALGTTASDYTEGDTLNFTHTVTSGGVDYPSGNSNTFSNSIRDFSLEIPVETVDLVSFSSDSVFLNANSRETITMTFENDFTNELVVLPTVTRISAKGQTDDTIGDVNFDSDRSAYTFTYASGTSDVDTISFIISDASALSSGFVMANDTFNTVFIIDNIDPTQVADISSLQTDGNTDTTGFRFNILFSEDIGDLTITSNFIDIDDDLDGDIDEEGEFTTVSATFSGSNLDYIFPWIGSEDGEVELTLEVRDRAGNILDYGTYITLETN